MIKRFLFVSYILFLLVFTVGCKKDAQLVVNIKNIDANVSILRFEKLMCDSLNQTMLNHVSQQYPDFITIYRDQIIQPDSSFLSALHQFQNHFDSTPVHSLIENQFADFSGIEEEFTQMQKRFKVLFEKYEMMDMITMNSGFNYKLFIVENACAVGLDMYLGDSIVYPQVSPSFHTYNQHTFAPEYLLPELSAEIIADFYPPMPELNTFLDRILYNGKILYLQDLVLPNADDYTLIGMTEEDYNWCKENEEEIWRFFVSRELLYSNEFLQFRSYIMEGPFSSGMPEDAPANTGSYIGWQIIKQYMKDKTTTDVPTLLANINSQQILQEAKYRP